MALSGGISSLDLGPTKRVPSGLRELQPSPPLFQQTPPLQALKRKPIHLSLKKLTFGDVF